MGIERVLVAQAETRATKFAFEINLEFGLRFLLRVVQDGIGDDQALDGTSADNVRIDNFIDVRGSNAAIPNAVRIYDHRGTNLALIEASRFVGAHFAVGNAALF